MPDEAYNTSHTLKDSDNDLIAENQQLSRQLRAFVSKVRQNEEKLRRFQELEISLISCTSLIDLLGTVFHSYRSTAKLDRATLLLHDPEYELRRILEEDGVDYQQHFDLIFTESRQHLESFFGLRPASHLGVYNPLLHKGMFHPKVHSPTSVAILPLVYKGEIVGSLNLGSKKSERFVQGTAADFLERFATIVTVCLQNVKNHEQLKRVGLTDVLTGVNNRRFFDQRLQEEVSAVQRSNSDLSCLFFDVDHFKQVNDRYGHHAGDIVLKEVAGIIRQSLRSTDILARYGGEEFAALLPNANIDIANEIAERIRANIEKRAFVLEDGETIRVTISIGMSTMENVDIGSAPLKLGNELVQKADDNLYIAKRSGRNRVVGQAVRQKLAECEE